MWMFNNADSNDEKKQTMVTNMMRRVRGKKYQFQCFGVETVFWLTSVWVLIMSMSVPNYKHELFSET